MPSPDPTSVAYQTGQVIGVVLVVGLPVLFGYFVYQYMSHKEKRHLVMSALTGIPTLLILGLFVVGIVSGISKVAKVRDNQKPMSANQLQEMKAGPWQEVVGEKYKYSFRLPDKASWTLKPATGDYDLIATYRELYVGIIPELLDIELANYSKLILENAKGKFADAEFSNEKDLTIDGKPWKSYEMKLTIRGMTLHYRNHLCAHQGKVVQVMSWCTESHFANCSEVIDRIAQSFRFNTF